MIKRFLFIFCLIPAICWGAVDFNGDADYIAITETIDFASSSWTVYAIIRWGGKTSEDNIIFGDSDSGGSNPNFRLAIDDSTSCPFAQWCNTGGGWPIALSDTALTTTADYILVGRGVGNSYIEIYVDGIKKGEDTDPGTPKQNQGGAPHIGRMGDYNGRQFDGIIYEVAYWNTAITTAEIALLTDSKLKHMPLQIKTANLVGYWTLDDHAAGINLNNLTFYDLSGNGNTGTGTDADDDSTVVAETVLSYPSPILGAQ